MMHLRRASFQTLCNYSGLNLAWPLSHESTLQNNHKRTNPDTLNGLQWPFWYFISAGQTLVGDSAAQRKKELISDPQLHRCPNKKKQERKGRKMGHAHVSILCSLLLPVRFLIRSCLRDDLETSQEALNMRKESLLPFWLGRAELFVFVWSAMFWAGTSPLRLQKIAYQKLKHIPFCRRIASRPEDITVSQLVHMFQVFTSSWILTIMYHF